MVFNSVIPIDKLQEMRELTISNKTPEEKLIRISGTGTSINNNEKTDWNTLAYLILDKYENEREYQAEVKICRIILAKPDNDNYKSVFNILEQVNREKFWDFFRDVTESLNCSECRNNKPIDISEKAFFSKLLKRDTTPIYSFSAKQLIKDKIILVTGAGGSIGSEIVRQLLTLEPKEIYCLDNDEYSLYKLSLEIYGNALLTNESIILADIRDKISISRIFAQINPDIVYHAAAHKHLPLLERSPAEAISTNVFGTDNIASACVKYGVKCFVNVSTDKAARPISVLGMTKRLAELCTAGYGNRIVTKVASVRFGNVLGSRGSFLSTLMWQVENNKPVTITHPEVSRFFITIPEAVSLVIEASSMATGGEIYLLDMGKSVKIVDLIYRYVGIIGCQNPTIIYTGLRSGEKLHEELFNPSEIYQSSTHPRIIEINVDQSKVMTYRDKRVLQSMISIETTPEELRYRLSKLIYLIENRTKIFKENIDRQMLIKN